MPKSTEHKVRKPNNFIKLWGQALRDEGFGIPAKGTPAYMRVKKRYEELKKSA